MKYLSLFSGIGAPEITLEKLGHECVGFSEIDKYAIQIYQKHFPDHKNYGDITKIKTEELPDFDFLVGGFPCQAFSIAGKRKGFEDTRGTLFFEVARILKDKSPRYFILENVKGLLSHDNGRTFRIIIEALTELGYCVEWQVLNSKNFGVPQNRERVYIVGYLGEGPGRKVFPIGEDDGVSEETITTNETQSQAEISGTLKAKGSMWSDDTFIVGGMQKHQTPRKDKISPTLTQAMGMGGGQIPIVGTLRTHNDGKGFREKADGMVPTIPARAREDGSGQAVIMQRARGNNKGGIKEICPTISGGAFKDNNHVIQIPSATKKGYEEAQVGDSINLSVINSATRRGRVGRQIAQTLDTGMQQYTIAIPCISPERINKRQHGRRFKENGDPSFTLTGQDQHGIYDGMRIRRLTPIECERLQGFNEIKKYVILQVCIDHQNNHVSVETKSPKLLKYVGNVENINSKESVLSVETSFSSSDLQTNKHAQPDVLIDCVENGVEIRSQGKLLLNAKCVEKKNWCHQYIKIDDFVQLLVGINLIKERIVRRGEEELHQNEQYSIAQQNGRMREKLSGNEIVQLAGDVENDLITLKELLKFTTLDRLDTGNLEQKFQTLSLFVIRAIIGYIPSEILNQDTFTIEVKTRVGYTHGVSDSQRYKTLGNAMTVNVVGEIIKRLCYNIKK